MTKKTYSDCFSNEPTNLCHASKLRLFTVQHKSVLDQFDAGLWYRPDWAVAELSDKERMAYEFALETMVRLELSDGRNPPVWAWQCDREKVAQLANELLSEAEREKGVHVVLELCVPTDRTLRSSYHGWCDLYFRCLETGLLDKSARWLDWEAVDPRDDDVIQVLLPGLSQSWITGTWPLAPPKTPDHRYRLFFAATSLCALLLLLAWFTTPLIFAFVEWPTNSNGFSWLKALYSLSYWAGIPLLIAGQIASLVSARKKWTRAAYSVPLAILSVFSVVAATLFILT